MAERIGLLGDTHGGVSVITTALDRFESQGIQNILQMGDFGFWNGHYGEAFLASVNTRLKANEQTLWVTPGNHDSYDVIRGLRPREDGWMVARQNILVAPRGHRWEWDGVSFVSLGGAPSVDRMWRLSQQRKTGFPVWWQEEKITEEDMEKTMEGGYADVMVAHDVPYGVPTVERNIAGNPFRFAQVDLDYAREGRFDMRKVVETVTPSLYLGGHYHFPVDEVVNFSDSDLSTTRVVVMSADGEDSSSGVLDLADLSVTFWKH